jgi:transmembrane sensor
MQRLRRSKGNLMRDDMSSSAEMQAIDWVVRQRDPNFADWDAFTVWLAEAPEHADIYDAVASLDVDLGSLPKPACVAMPSERRFRPALPRRAWLGGAVAAAVIGAISLSQFHMNGSVTRIETAAGEHRTVALADGSRIEINGASVVTVDQDRPRFAQLDAGEAMFHVVHREGDPFIVKVGDTQLEDLGTAFNVVRNQEGLSVSVSEGMIVYNPGRQNVRVAAGQAIIAKRGAARPLLHDIDVANVGGWRTGQLVYGGASLTEVAQDLKRTAGMSVAVAPDVANLSFRGVLIVGKDQNRTIADLTALAGIRAEKQAEGWLLTR